MRSPSVPRVGPDCASVDPGLNCRGPTVSEVEENQIKWAVRCNGLTRENEVEIYLDANATTALSATACEALFAALEGGPQNPSSAHQFGTRARALIERARQDIADLLGKVDSENVVLTSGGTEANNILVRGFAELPSAIFCTAVEHPSVLNPVTFLGGAVLPVDNNGILNIKYAIDAVSRRKDRDFILLSIQAANSETGIIQPLDYIIKKIREVREDVFVMVDAAQAFGRVPLIVECIDALTISGHKLHAPAGTGVLYLSDRMLEVLPPVIHGGGQERGFRPGTQNVAGAASLAAALGERISKFSQHVEKLGQLRHRLETRILELVPTARIIGASIARVPNTSNIMFPGIDAQALLARLDAEGVYCSTGSACSSARPEASPVLKAMGMSEREASSCLRFSVSVDNTQEEMDAAAQIVGKCVSEGLRIGL